MIPARDALRSVIANPSMPSDFLLSVLARKGGKHTLVWLIVIVVALIGLGILSLIPKRSRPKEITQEEARRILNQYPHDRRLFQQWQRLRAPLYLWESLSRLSIPTTHENTVGVLRVVIK
jgi:hypothetical protein